MSRGAVTVTTGSRLHFGLISFGQPGVRQFGGVGVMIDSPGVTVKVSAAPELTVVGPLAETVARHADAVARARWFSRELACRIETVAIPPAHAGLGSGTQLALAVATGICSYCEVPRPTASELLTTLGRGRRSAVGFYGFLQGGLIAEAGKLREDEISPLIQRVEMPSAWRFLLVRQIDAAGLSGEAERRAFERLPPIPLDASARMCQEALLGLLPAALTANFDAFSESLYRFGQEAGRCFLAQQGGVYATDGATAIAAELRRLGIAGVAQSSWGPTVFAVVESADRAEQVSAQIQAGPVGALVTCHVARPLNEPARLNVEIDC